MSISNSKCYTWICAGFSHQVTWSCETKTHRFSSTCGSTGTWKYLQVLSILNRNKVVNCQHKYMWNKIHTFKMLCHTDRTKYGSISCTLHHQSALFLSLSLPSHIKNIVNFVSYNSKYQKLIKCSYLG